MKWVEMMKKSQHFFDPAAKHREKMINRIYKGSGFVFLYFLSTHSEFSFRRETDSKMTRGKSWAICKILNIEIEKIDQNTNFAKLPSAKWLFFVEIVHFSIQILKSMHIVCLSFWDMSCDPEFRILISVQKMCPKNFSAKISL